MQTLPLAIGQPVRVSRGGPMLHVLNNPALDYALSATVPAQVLAITVLVGFDHVPSLGAYDAVVPPFAQLDLVVPETVTTIYLLFAGDNGRAMGARSSASAPATSTTVAIEWSECVVEPGVRPTGSALPFRVASQPYLIPADSGGNLWSPGPSALLLDQGQGGGFAWHLRPPIAPSMVDTIHAVTAINTLFNFLGGFGFLAANQPASQVQFQVLHRVIVSVSAATLFVFGQQGLTVGSPGNQELGRLAFPAAGIQVIEYGEGLELNAMNGTPGVFRAYTSAAVTLEATVIGG